MKVFSCKSLTPFIKSVVRALPYSGASQSRFYICEHEGIDFLVKLSFYWKIDAEIYTELPDTMPGAGAEIGILRKLRAAITDKGLSPCILELVHVHDCEGLDSFKLTNCSSILRGFGDKSLTDSIYHGICDFRHAVSEGLAYDKLSFLVLDRCDITLDEFLHRKVDTPVMFAVFKSIIFMVCHAMYAISTVYPQFRHYDLHTENVLLKIDPDYEYIHNNPQYLEFGAVGKKFTLPYFGLMPKIIDFDRAALPEEGIVSSSVSDKRFMHFRADNDLLWLFHFIYHALRNVGGDKYGWAEELILRLNPSGLHVAYYTKHINERIDLIPTYAQVMENDVWDEYLDEPAVEGEIRGSYMMPA